MELLVDKDIEAFTSQYDIEPKVKEELHRRGISLVKKPDFSKHSFIEYTETGEPVICHDLTALSSQEIGTMYSIISAYSSFLSSEHALSSIQLMRWTEIKSLIFSALRAASDKTKKDDRDNEVVIHPKYTEVNNLWMQAKAMDLILELKEKQFERCARLLSRELTRRQLELEENRLGGRFERPTVFPKPKPRDPF